MVAEPEANTRPAKKMVNFTEFLNCTVGNASIEYGHCLEEVPPYEDCPDPTVCKESSGENVGLAFGLTIGAGLATTLGALLPFVPFIKRGNTRYLAAAMALAAGVMLYVSFTEIRTKSLNSFCCETQDHYDVLATSCFFGGILLTAVLDVLVWALQKVDCGFSFARLKRVKFSTKKDRVIILGEEDEEREQGRRRKTAEREKIHLHAVNANGFINSMDDVERLDSSALILPHKQGGGMRSTNSSSQSTTPTASSLEEGCDVLETEIEMATERQVDDEETSVLQSQTSMGEAVGGGGEGRDGVRLRVIQMRAEGWSGGVWHAVIRCSNEIAVWAVEFAVVTTSNHRQPTHALCY